MLLKEIVEKNHYRFADSFSSWKEAVYGACEPLLEDGIIDENYPQAIIRNVETYGPYFVILPDVAMPHAGKDDGVSGTAICFVKVKEAVVFDEKDISKNAKIFFTLAAADEKKHLENMVKLTELLSKDGVVEDLLKCENAVDLLKVDVKYENR